MSFLKTTAIQAGSGVALTILVAFPAIAGQEASSFRQGLPGRRISGGTRSECMAGSAPVVALSPVTNVGETVSANPSIYFMVPETESAYPLEFSLRDSEGNRLYEKSLNTHENQGVVGIQLPLQTLEANQDHRWYLSVVCDAQDPSQNDVLSGWLRQVEPEFAIDTSLDEALFKDIDTSLELALGYQEAGLWTDAIATVVELREQYPTDVRVRRSWDQLLYALEVDVVVEVPIAMSR